MSILLGIGTVLVLALLRAVAVDEVRGRIQRRLRASVEATIASLPVEVQAEWGEEMRSDFEQVASMPLTALRFVVGLHEVAAALAGDPTPTSVDAQANRGGRAASGTWWQHIPAHGSEPSKLDHVVCRYDGDEVSGTIRRVAPEQQTGMRWVFHGHVRRGMVFAAYFSNDPGYLSYGTIMLRVGGPMSKWTGFYNRLRVIGRGPGRREEIDHVGLYWSRSRGVDLPAGPRSAGSQDD